MTTQEAFGKWFKKEFGDAYYPTDGMKLAWQASTTKANKRIAELESEVNYLKAGIAEELEQRILDLQANNNSLREALEKIVGHDMACSIIAKQALEATPAQSMKGE